jgi:hypothetical protein
MGEQCNAFATERPAQGTFGYDSINAKFHIHYDFRQSQGQSNLNDGNPHSRVDEPMPSMIDGR